MLQFTFSSSVFLRTLLFTLLCSVFSPHYVSGQTGNPEGCGTEPGPYAVGETPENPNVTPAFNYYLRLYVYILRPSNGNGGMTLQEVEQSLAILDEDFNEHNIFFVRSCPIVIKDDDLYAGGSGNFCRLFYENNHPYRNSDGINLYFGSITTGNGFNIASGIISNCAIVNGKISGYPQHFRGLFLMKLAIVLDFGIHSTPPPGITNLNAKMLHQEYQFRVARNWQMGPIVRVVVILYNLTL